MFALRVALRLNALSCVLFGIAFVVWPASIAEGLGDVPVTWLYLAGTLLLINGSHLVIASMRSFPSVPEVLYLSTGDILWFYGSLVLVAANTFITTPGGQLMTMIVASVVLVLGLAQIWLLADTLQQESRSNVRTVPQPDSLLPPHYSRLGAIVASWISIKGWIKAWLFLLNGIFLAAVASLPDQSARWVLAAYVATVPLLAGMIIWQRGLTRLLGIAHLIPWLPLVLYIAMCIAGGTLSVGLRTYLAVLLAATIACLVMDIYDCWRWLKGERFRFGSRQAALQGASGTAP